MKVKITIDADKDEYGRPNTVIIEFDSKYDDFTRVWDTISDVVDYLVKPE